MNSKGFTIVELLIVIVIIGILATLSYAGFIGMQERARVTKMKSDLALIQKSIKAAHTTTGKTALEVTGNLYNDGGTGGPVAACINKLPVGTDLATLDRGHNCWRSYNHFLKSVGAAGGVSIEGVEDPWKRPYALEIAETPGNCRKDRLWVFSQTFGTWSGRYPGVSVEVPLSDANSNC